MTRPLPAVAPALIALLAAVAALAATRAGDAAPALGWLAGALAAGVAVWGLAALRGARLDEWAAQTTANALAALPRLAAL